MPISLDNAALISPAAGVGALLAISRPRHREEALDACFGLKNWKKTARRRSQLADLVGRNTGSMRPGGMRNSSLAPKSLCRTARCEATF